MCTLWIILTLMALLCDCFSLTFVTIGMGSVGKRITRLALDNGLQCVVAITRESNLGKDVDLIVGLNEESGIKITSNQDNLNKLLSETKPNIIFESIIQFNFKFINK